MTACACAVIEIEIIDAVPVFHSGGGAADAFFHQPVTAHSCASTKVSRTRGTPGQSIACSKFNSRARAALHAVRRWPGPKDSGNSSAEGELRTTSGPATRTTVSASAGNGYARRYGFHGGHRFYGGQAGGFAGAQIGASGGTHFAPRICGANLSGMGTAHFAGGFHGGMGGTHVGGGHRIH